MTTSLPATAEVDVERHVCRTFSKVFAECRPATLKPQQESVRVRELREWNGERMFLHYDWDCRKLQFVAASLRLQLSPSRRQIWLGSLEIHHHHRRRGVGTAIIVALEKAAVAADIDSIRLFTRPTASRFWNYLGYQIEADRRYFRKNLRYLKS